MFAQRIILYWIGLFVLSACLRAEGENSTNSVPQGGTNYQSFRIISERNIFNQNRSTRSARRDSPRPRNSAAVQTLSLVGTMSYEKGEFAFFDGSKSEFRKPLKEGEKIAGYEVKEIQPSRVKIANETEEFDLKVGQQLRREDEGNWHLAIGSAAASPSSPAISDSSSDTATSSGGNASEDEALKRLMEKRAKETSE